MATPVAKIHAKIELSLFGIPANRAHPERDFDNINNWLDNYYYKEHGS